MMKRKKFSFEEDDFDNVESDLLLLEQLDEIDKALPLNTASTQNVTIRRVKERCCQMNAGSSTATITCSDIHEELLQMTQKADTLAMRNSELEGCLQMLKFKTENLEKEKEQLQATIIDVKNRGDKQVAEERALREKTEEDLRTLRTTQEIDHQTRIFRERLLSNQSSLATAQQSGTSPLSSSLVSKKVVVPERTPRAIGSHFLKSLDRGSDNLKHLFTHPKEYDSVQMTFPVILSQNVDYSGEPAAKRFAASAAPLEESRRGNQVRASTVDAQVQASIVNPYEALETFSKKKIFDVLWSMCNEMGAEDFWNTQYYDVLRGIDKNPQLLADAVEQKT